ncbi:MAG: RsmE family RNA methyltransferase [Candidatus Acidiferrales bacterium]
MRRRFFLEKFDGTSATLHGDTAEHLGRVLRAEPGQLYELSDGQRVWLGRIERVALSKRGDSRIQFALVEPVVVREACLQTQLLIALVKFDRFEWCLEKATELGAASIVPLAAARTDKPLLSAAEKRRARWERILLESAQQSRRLRAPVLGAVATPQEAFAECDAACRILLSERSDALPMREALVSVAGMRTAALAIGPEGGWTDDEIRAARAAGFQEASLGENILRTETAVLSALSILGFAAGAQISV